jgi:hypothetical protein
MQSGMAITADTKTGVIVISAGHGLDRTYTWEGGSRAATLWPRPARWNGSLGAYYPGPGEHWREHNGITRGVLQEGQQHFQSEQQATDWLRKQSGYYPTIYRDDGLVVSFGKTLARRQINVEVWQIFIRGAKPQTLAGSDHSKIKISNQKTQ